MNILKIIICTVLATTALKAHAIIDIEKSRGDNKTSNTKSTVGISLSGKRGNTDNFDLRSNFDIYWKELNEENIILAEQTYTKSNGSASSQDFLIHLRKILNLDQHNAFEYYTQFQTDKIRGIKNRSLIGSNIRLKRAISQNNPNNYFGLGAFYFKQYYTDNLPNGKKSLQGVRANLYWSNKTELTEATTVSSTIYVQPKLNDISDTDILATSTLTAPLSDKINVKISIKYTYLNTAPLGFENDEFRYYTGFTYSF